MEGEYRDSEDEFSEEEIPDDDSAENENAVYDQLDRPLSTVPPN